MKNGWNTVRMCVLSVIFLRCFAGKMPESGMFRGCQGKKMRCPYYTYRCISLLLEKIAEIMKKQVEKWRI